MRNHHIEWQPANRGTFPARYCQSGRAGCERDFQKDAPISVKGLPNRIITIEIEEVHQRSNNSIAEDLHYNY